jgi:anion-transporting  ArsA/GET3 family ATPase
MDDPLSRALREDEQKDLNQNGQPSSPDPMEADLNGKTSSLSISHSHNEWILPSTNECKEEVEINREQIKIYVCDPKKHKSNLDSFITYLITTQTYNDSVKINESNVRRRYNDFIWLKTLLDTKYPFNIISPLPAKHTLSKKLHVVADDGEFIRRRMIGKKSKTLECIFLFCFCVLGLQNFLQRIIDNPIISIDPSVQLFLTADDDTLHSAQQQQSPSSPLTPQVISSNSSPFRQPMGRGKPIPSEFSRTENQIQTLQDNLRKLERLTRKIESDQVSIQAEEEHLLSAFKQWLDTERKYDENDSFIETLCNTQQTIVDNQNDLLKFTNTKFIEPINEYVLFTNIVQDILKRRSQLSENVTTSNNEEMFDQLTIANETIKADIQRWTESKDKELIDLFHSLADKKVDFYSQSVNVWEQAAAKLSPPNNKR